MSEENTHYSVHFNPEDMDQTSDETRVFLKQFGPERVSAINRLRDRAGTVDDARLLAAGADPLVTDGLASITGFGDLDEDEQQQIRITDVLAHEGGAEVLVASVVMANVVQKYPDNWREKLAPANIDGQWGVGDTLERALQRLENRSSGMSTQELMDLKIAADLLDATSYQFSLIKELQTADQQHVSDIHMRQNAEHTDRLRGEIARIAALDVPQGVAKEEQIANYFVGLKVVEQMTAHRFYITTVIDKNGGVSPLLVPDGAGRKIKLWSLQTLIDYMETTIVNNNVIEQQYGRDKKGPILEAMLLIDSFMIMLSQNVDKHVVVVPSREGQDEPKINYPRLKRGIDLVGKNLLSQDVQVYNAKNRKGDPDSRRNTNGYEPQIRVLVEDYQPSSEEIRQKLGAYRYIIRHDFESEWAEETIDELALRKAKEMIEELK